MNAVTRLPLTSRANTVQGWRIPAGSTQGYPLDRVAENLADALNELAPRCFHKDALALLEKRAGSRDAVLHIYTIKQESKATYVRNPATGVPEAVRRLYPDKVLSVAVDAFAPVLPFDALRDDVVGVDRGLVSQGGGR